MKPSHILSLVLAFTALLNSATSHAQEARWWKGNLHTHTLWSDGDDYPEMVGAWYKTNGWNFLMLTDHNVLAQGERWLVATNRGGGKVLDKYVAAYGKDWVNQRTNANGKPEVRLKTFEEFSTKLNTPSQFLMIPGEEISDKYKVAPVHINFTNPRKVQQPQGGDSVLEVIQRNFDAAAAQRAETGQPMYTHLNHPNFRWGVTAEEMMPVRGLKFFEVYNGHPSVYNEGDATHAGLEKVWDICLAHRLTSLKLDVLYGLGTDDSHNYQDIAVGKSNTGRGWVMVRSKELSINALIAALEAGDFYTSSGVTLKDVQRKDGELSLEVAAEPGVEYTIEFVGTKRGFDPKSEPVRAANGEALRVTRRYSDDIGKVFATVKGTKASYKLQTDDIYVRARISSTKVKVNPYRAGEFEQAWVQPLVNTK
ncbi:MAG: PHP domain-containing protein [Verrucomicrobiota bacterium]